MKHSLIVAFCVCFLSSSPAVASGSPVTRRRKDQRLLRIPSENKSKQDVGRGGFFGAESRGSNLSPDSAVMNLEMKTRKLQESSRELEDTLASMEIDDVSSMSMSMSQQQRFLRQREDDFIRRQLDSFLSMSMSMEN